MKIERPSYIKENSFPNVSWGTGSLPSIFLLN